MGHLKCLCFFNHDIDISAGLGHWSAQQVVHMGIDERGGGKLIGGSTL